MEKPHFILPMEVITKKLPNIFWKRSEKLKAKFHKKILATKMIALFVWNHETLFMSWILVDICHFANSAPIILPNKQIQNAQAAENQFGITPKFFIKHHRSKNNHANWNPFQEKITYLHPMILKFKVLNKYKSTYRESIWSGVEIENIHSLLLL